MPNCFPIKICWIVLLVIFCTSTHAQIAQSYIYGTITLKNGAQYQGQIRWENEEALWDDTFNASKYERPMQNLLTEAEARQVERRTDDFKFGFMELWEDKSPNQNFAFRCDFGYIYSLRNVDDDVVLLTLKNGSTIKLKQNRGGDLNQDILIYDNELGQLDLEFEDIRSIVFQATPSNFQSKLGDPIYAKVLTTTGQFEGFITWDSEECLGKDLLGGRQKGIKIEIEFEDIAELKTQDDGSLVTLKSGRSIFLNDHSDVSRKNRGILIRGLDFGKLEFEWENLIAVTFQQPPPSSRSYDDFQAPQLLSGTVYTKSGHRYQGQIVYDLDEIYNVEYLNGFNSDFEYQIPFAKVKRIEPQNDKFSLVYLKNGDQYLLGGNPDVNDANHGLLLKFSNDRAEYIEWEKIKHIDFE